jgi:hypothetical protein
MAELAEGTGLIIAAEATAERGIAILATAAGPIIFKKLINASSQWKYVYIQ